jgi:hypothetical protein
VVDRPDAEQRERIPSREERQRNTLDATKRTVLRLVVGEGALRGAVGSRGGHA